MEDSLILQLSGCSPSTPSPRPLNTCRLVPLLGTPAKAPDLENLNRSFQKTAKSSVLHGVVAYVDVRSESDNRSRAVGHELQQLGATVVDRFSEEVTHLVYKDGKKRTLDMALRRKIHLVSVLWVESCKQNQCKVSEDEFRVTLPKKQTPIGPIKFKRYKSMQPKAFDEEVVLSEEKVRRRQQRKEKVEKIRPLKTPESSRRQNFFVAETCRRSPTRDELVTPTSICVPDTPPSMRRHLAKSQSARRGSCAVPSPHFSLSVNPLQRKFSFEADDSSPEPISVSSGSHPLSRSSQDSSHPSVIAPPRTSINSSRTTTDGASGPAIQSGRTILSESMSPEIELQTSKPLPPFMNSSSSFETEKKEIDFKHSDFKPKNNDFKSSPTKQEFEAPSSKTSPCFNRMTLGLSTTKIKRQHSPSIEEMTISNKRRRVDENVKGTETVRSVSLIPLSQLNLEFPSPESSRTKSGLGQTSARATHDNNDSENLSATESAKLKDSSSKTRPKSLKSFVHSSPTSSQEASRNHRTPLPSRTLPAEFCPRNIEQHSMEIALNVGGFELATFETLGVRSFVTPFNRPPTCADSLVLETRVQKRRSLVPFHDVLKTNTKAISRRKTLMNGALDADHCNDSARNSISPSKVVLQRLPGAWDQSKSISSEYSTPVTRKILSENAGIRSSAKSKSNGVNDVVSLTAKVHKMDVGKSVSNGGNTVISPSAKQPNRDIIGKSRSNSGNTVISPSAKQSNRDAGKSRSNGVISMASPSTKQPKRDAGKNESCGVSATALPARKTTGRSNQGTDLVEKEKSSDERRARKTVKQKKMKKSSSASSTSSNELIVGCSLPSIVITSLHRNEQKIVSDIVQSLGSYVLSENVNEQTTHIVAGGNRRTVKVLAGISRGLWIISLDWVKRSAEKGKWLPEEPFELTEFFPAAKISRLERERRGRDYRHDLFSEVGDVFVADGSAPPKEELEHLVSLCHGKVTKQLRTAKVCVGKFLRQSITNVSEKWILDCITQHQCLPTTDYMLNA